MTDPMMEPMMDRGKAVWEAIEAHRTDADQVLPTGDAAAIKRLYVELGARLESAAAGDSDATPVLSFPENAPVVAALAADIRGRILDAGCGPNPVVSLLLATDARRTLIAMDIGLGTVRLAMLKAQAVGVRLLPVVGDAEALPFQDATIDGCVSEDTIEHLPDDSRGVAELARVLRAGGRAIIATPNRVRLEVVQSRVRDRLRGVRKEAATYYASNSHLREYTWRDLERLVRPRFRVRRRAGVGWTGGWKARLATRLVQRWPGRAVSRMVVLDLEPR